MRSLQYLLLPFLLLLFSCGENTAEEQSVNEKELAESDYETLKREVMNIHDAVMPEVSTIMEYTKTLKASMDTVTDDAVAKSEAVIARLKEADRAMMEWMRAYDDPEAVGMSLDSAIQYMKDQKIKIEVVDSLMRTSLKNAKEYIERLED